MKYLLLGLAILSSVPFFAQDTPQDVSEDGTRFFWSDKIEAEIVKKLLILVNNALDYKVQSSYFYDALQEIALLVDSIEMQSDEKVALQNKIASLIKVLFERSSHEVSSLKRMRREIEMRS